MGRGFAVTVLIIGLGLTLVSATVIFVLLRTNMSFPKQSDQPTNKVYSSMGSPKIDTINEPLKIHAYRNPNVSLRRIQVYGVLFVPKNIELEKSKQYQQHISDWPNVMEAVIKRTTDFWSRELDGRAQFSIEIIKVPIEGSRILSDYNFSRVQEEVIQALGEKVFLPESGEDTTVTAVYVANDDECAEYSKLGYSSYQECGIAKGKIYYDYSRGTLWFLVSTDIFYAESQGPHGPITTAHEFGHALGIPHPYDDYELSSGDLNFGKESGNLMGHGQCKLEDCFLMKEQKELMGL